MSQSPTKIELNALAQALKLQELERANKEKAKEVLLRIQATFAARSVTVYATKK